MNMSDRIADGFLEHAVDLMRFESDLRQRTLRLLQRLESDLSAEIARFEPTATGRPTFRQRRLQALLEQTDKTIATAYENIRGQADSDLAEVTELETRFSRSLIDQAVGASVMTVSVPETQLREIARDTLIEGAPSRDWWHRQSDGIRTRFEDTMKQGALRGESVDELVRRVRGTKARNYNDGVMATSRRQATALVRSSIQTIPNHARMAAFEANSDIIRGVQALVTLDARTSEICIARSGAAWDLEGRPLPSSPRQEPFPGPPGWHWQCRSTLIAVLKALDELLESVGVRKAGRIGEVPKSTRASMDGQVAEDLTYEDWLATKPESFQKRVLGQGKWRLWKTGGLSLSQLIDQSGNPLSLSELKAIVAGQSVPEDPESGPTPAPAPAPFPTGPKALPGAPTQKALPAPEPFVGPSEPFTRKATVISRRRKVVSKLPELEQNIDPFQIEPTWALEEGEDWRSRSYGGVVFDDLGRVLIREPRGHFGGFVWTWPKGRAEETDVSPGIVALREVLEETAHKAEIVGLVKGTHRSDLSKSNFFVMRSKAVDESAHDGETRRTRWVTIDEARAMLQETRHAAGRERDLAVLDGAAKAHKDLIATLTRKRGPRKPTSEFPDRLEELTEVSRLGGSTGALLMQDRQGRRFVLKRGASPEHLREEFAAEEAYRAAGAAVAASRLYETGRGPVKLAKFIEGEALASLRGKARQAAEQRVREHFVTDALLGNYDVVGLAEDNILIDRNGVAWRIDVGGSLRFRAQGARKTNWGPQVSELDTLRDPKINANAARVFRPISNLEIETQIRHIVERRDQIQTAVPEAVRGLIRQRIDFLGSRLQPSVFDDAFAQGVRNARVVGRTHIGDRDLVEDMTVLFWQEQDRNGQWVTRLKMRLTEEGSDAIVYGPVRDQLSTVAPQVAGKRIHPRDTFWDQIEAGLKTVNVHQKDGAYNQTTVNSMKALQEPLSHLLNDPDTQTQQMARKYLDAIDTALRAMEKRESTPFFQQYELPEPEERPDSGRYQVASSGLKWQQKEKVAGRARQLPSTVFEIKDGYEIRDGDVAVQLVPWNTPQGHKSRAQYAFRGQLEVELPGQATPERLNRVAQTMRGLGVDIVPATSAYQELVYLRKGLEMRSYDLLSSAQNHRWREIFSGPDDDATKVRRLREFVESEMGIRVSKGPTEDYNPAGRANTWGDGWVHWERWDLPRKQIESKLKGYGITHSSSTPTADLIDSLLSGGGQVTPTTERLRTGVPISAGMSPVADMGTGGANYFFTRIRQPAAVRGHRGLVFKIGSLARMDAFSFSHDVFGDVRPPGENQHGIHPRRDRARTIEQFRQVARSSGNETDFKWGLHLLDDIDRINASTPSERARIIDVFKRHKIDRLPDGRPIEEVVKLVGT